MNRGRIHHKLRFAARNEGKIKSYESCVDIRAWSHDIQLRDSYLRDWIRSDMPICYIPVCTLTSILTIMSCKCRGKLPPRCLQGCKSKIMLDNISSSCTAMKDCLRNSTEFNKYFEEEDFATLHWPCERCLEILKSIKMFWKIVIERVLKIHQSKINEYKTVNSSIRNIVQEWKKEMEQDAAAVKSTLVSKQNGLLKPERVDNLENGFEVKERVKEENERKNIDVKNKLTETENCVRSIAIQQIDSSVAKNITKSTSASIKMANTLIGTSKDNVSDELDTYKNNVKNLQDQFISQKREMDRLEKENMTLNIQLQCIHQNRLKRSLYHESPPRSVEDTVMMVPSHFENDSNEMLNDVPIKNINSEMIITVKNCTNEQFRHVSLLQVLHKTNRRLIKVTEKNSCTREDPINLLNKVQQTFEAIVNREISIANNIRNRKNNNVEIKTTYRNADVNQSAPSCSTSTYSLITESDFESAKDTSS